MISEVTLLRSASSYVPWPNNIVEKINMRECKVKQGKTGLYFRVQCLIYNNSNNQWCFCPNVNLIVSYLVFRKYNFSVCANNLKFSTLLFIIQTHFADKPKHLVNTGVTIWSCDFFFFFLWYVSTSGVAYNHPNVTLQIFTDTQNIMGYWRLERTQQGHPQKSWQKKTALGALKLPGPGVLNLL